MNARIDPDLFRRAKDQSDIKVVAGVKLFKAGQKWRGECPLCGSGAKKKASGPFVVDTVKQRFKCWTCGEPGDVIELEQKIRGGSLFEAAKRLAGEAPAAQAIAMPASAPKIIIPEGPNFSERLARQVWQEAIPAAGSLAQRYLMSRCITGKVMVTGLRFLRFHPHVYHSGPPSRPLTFPGMVALVVVAGPDGKAVPTGGIHVTYLARDGSGKAPKPRDWDPDAKWLTKKMFGPQGVGGCPGGLWLSPLDVDGPAIGGEGIESSFSMAILEDAPCRVFAALTLDRLQGGYLSDKYGRFDPDMPRPDAERPAFTWPGIDRVIIGVDHDMSPLKIKTRTPVTGGTMSRWLTATERAALCGTLAKAAWKRAGSIDVRIVAPGLGEDFNDMLIRTMSA